MSAPQQDTLARLEQLTLDLSRSRGANASLLREHLESARFYKTGAMPEEFLFNLKLAKRLLPDLGDQDLQSRIAEFLKSVEREEGSALD
jgi:hypothetical protein